MFSGNVDGNNVHKNEFEVPIITQWIRINPTRWRDRISMRVELFGCEYGNYPNILQNFQKKNNFSFIVTEADNMYFNGTALLKYDLFRDQIVALSESIKFRFKTTSANGVLLYSRGTQGDFLALQLRDNQLLLNIDLGK